MEILGEKLLSGTSSGTGVDFVRSQLSLLPSRGGRYQSKQCSSSAPDLQLHLIFTARGWGCGLAALSSCLLAFRI